MNSRNGVAFHNYYGGVHWGNASNWGNAARSLGISVDNAPAVGAIAWWSTGYGHVAWVEAVSGGSVTIEEYNNPAGSGNYKRRTISASNPTEYIHIKDLGGGETQTPVDFGTNFYTYIFNQPCWKTVACDPNGSNVHLETEKWTANQRWFAIRNDDGSYTFKNAKNNKCLDVNGAYDANGTNVQVWDYNGGDAQRWFIYAANGQYILMPKCSKDKVMDLAGANTADGTNIQICVRSNNDAQKFTLYKVDDCKAGKPEINVNADNLHTSDSAFVSWNPTEYTDQYVYYLTEFPGAYAYETNTVTGTTSNNFVSFNNLTSGNYSCFIHAISHQGNWGEQSNWVSFNVYESDYVPTKTICDKNHIYALYDYEMSWTFARDLCSDLGGHLATITDSQENDIITDLIQAGSKDAYWLGATDYGRAEKDFAWITGEEFSYSDWKVNEPNSDGVNALKECYAEIRKSYGNKWNDACNINKTDKGFILEIDTADIEPIYSETYNNNTYLLFDKNTTWTEAEYYCEMLGGHLAAVNSDEENEFIKNFLQNGDKAWYYLGAQKKDNDWQWVDGNNYSNITWNENAANWKGTRLMMYKTEKNCVGIDNAYFPESHIDRIGFVCEIEKEPEIPIKTRVITKTATEKLSLVNTVYAELENLAARDMGCDVIFVYKYADGSIAKTDIQIVTVPAKQTLNAESSVSNRIIDLGGNFVNSVEVYVWNSADGMIPLAEKKIGSFDYDY